MVTDSSEYGFSNKDAAGLQVRSTFSYPMFRQFVADNQTLVDLFACAPYGRTNVVVAGQAELATTFISSGNYYRMLGLTANPGRTIVPEDDNPTAAPVAVISASYWHTRFASDPGIVGRVIHVNNAPVTIVGVMTTAVRIRSRRFATSRTSPFPCRWTRRWPTPVHRHQVNRPTARLQQPTTWWLQVMGRLNPGVTPAQVHANFDGVFQHTARSGLDAYLGTLSEEGRANSRNRNRTEVPHLKVDSGSRGFYDVNVQDPMRGHHPERRGCAASADRLCQCRESAAVTGRNEATRDLDPAVARRHTRDDWFASC